ncbi:MAG: aldehyde ferredoxin oxidoreductase family protein [Candidatus Methanofastidiosa archaeon]|nr:aldehyde ferredoxin oxidoreductase family protein [Candidatus Methanofastidiosa archaeon]
MFGWSGRVADVSLSDRTALFATTPFYEDFVGGRGLGVRLFFERATPSIDPYDPSCPLVFAIGPLVGTPAPTAGRMCAVSKSPLTGTICDGNCGGFIAGKAKACGIDALCIEGGSDTPCIVVIREDGISFEDATSLWGMDIPSSAEALRARYGPAPGILLIGPAGESLVRYATISTDDLRVFGRGGLGAVMGAKRLKAIVFQGNRRTEIADREQLRFVCQQARKLLEANPITSRGLRAFGTPILVNITNTMGLFPQRNYQASHTDKADLVSGETINTELFVKRRACLACPIQCDRLTRAGEGVTRGPEYESVWALGPDCGIYDLPSIALANKACNDLGLDTISCGATIACAMELSEKGLYAASASFGDAHALVPLINDIARRSGAGADLAEGSARLARACGAPDLSMSVKGLELPGYDPRGAQGMGLAYAVSNRGACHLRSYILASEILGIPKLLDRTLTTEKVSLEVVLENLNAAVDSIGMCRFTSFALSEEYYSRLLSSVTGVDYSEEGLLRLGERIWNLERLYNNRAGFTSEDDTLPSRILHEPVPSGPSAGHVCRLHEMLPDYYRARGWDEQGRPRQKKLAEVGLDHV